MNHYPPERCDREDCSVNFNFDLNEQGCWFNMPAIPAGFGWSTDEHDGQGLTVVLFFQLDLSRILLDST